MTQAEQTHVGYLIQSVINEALFNKEAFFKPNKFETQPILEDGVLKYFHLDTSIPYEILTKNIKDGEVIVKYEEKITIEFYTRTEPYNNNLY